MDGPQTVLSSHHLITSHFHIITSCTRSLASVQSAVGGDWKHWTRWIVLWTDSRSENTGSSENKPLYLYFSISIDKVLLRCCCPGLVLIVLVKIRGLQIYIYILQSATKHTPQLKRLFPNMNIALLKLKSSAKQNEFAGNHCCKTNVKEFLSQFAFEFPVLVSC